MADPTIVRVTHRYNLPAERVFDAWITPATAARFLFATRTGNVLHCEIDAQVGGEFLVTDRRPTADGDESFLDAQHRGTYIEIDRPSRLVFDFSVEPYSGSPTRVALDFVTLGPTICDIVLTHHLGDDETAQVMRDRTRLGWERMLEQLDKVLNARTWGFRPVG
ncbi:MAG: SRPBCC domain-containing protein [Pseudomonadota bacterium]